MPTFADRFNAPVSKGFDAKAIELRAREMCALKGLDPDAFQKGRRLRHEPLDDFHAWVGPCGTDITELFKNGARAGPSEVWRDFIPDAQCEIYGIDPVVDFYGPSDLPEELD